MASVFAITTTFFLSWAIMKILLSHPTREVEVQGPKRVTDLFQELNLIPEAFLVIRNDTLMTEDEMLSDGDVIEVRPVISGG